MSAPRLSQGAKKPISERISIFEQSKQQSLSVGSKSHGPLSKTFAGKNFDAIKSQFGGGSSPTAKSTNAPAAPVVSPNKSSTPIKTTAAPPTTTPNNQGGRTSPNAPGSSKKSPSHSRKSSSTAEPPPPTKDKVSPASSTHSKVKSSPFRIQSQNQTNTSKPATLSASATPAPSSRSSASNNINRVPVTPSARAKSQSSPSPPGNAHPKLTKTSSNTSSGRTTPVKRTPSNSSIGSNASSNKYPLTKSQTLPIQPSARNGKDKVTIIRRTTLTEINAGSSAAASKTNTRVVKEKASTSPVVPKLTVTRENSSKSLPKVSEALPKVPENTTTVTETLSETPAKVTETLPTVTETLPKVTEAPPKPAVDEIKEPEPVIEEESIPEPATPTLLENALWTKDEKEEESESSSDVEELDRTPSQSPELEREVDEVEEEKTPVLVAPSYRRSPSPELASLSPVPPTIYEEEDSNERVIEEKSIIITDRRRKPSLHNQTSTLVIETLDPKHHHHSSSSEIFLEQHNRKNSLTNGKGYNNSVAMKLDLDYKDEKISALSKELEDLHAGGATDEEVSSLKRQRNDLDKRLKDQEEELDDLAGQVQMLEQAKTKLEMSMAALKKEHRREISSKEDELEDARNAALKKVKALEQQLESEHEERIGFVREKHELETKIMNLRDLAARSTDEDIVAKLKKDLKRTKALLKDAQYMLERSRNETSSKVVIRQLKNQLEEAEHGRTAAIKARQNTDLELSDVQQQLDDVMRSKSDVEDKLFRLGREKADMGTQLEDHEAELSEVMKKYKASVAQLSVDQITIHEQVNAITDLEEERNQLREQLAEFTQKIQSLEGENVSTAQHHRLELKIKELEAKLDLEQTTRGRMESQINRLKEAIEKLNLECDQLRSKEHSAQELIRKLQRQLRDLKEDHTNLQAKETEVDSKKNELEKNLELAEAETVTARNDLKLAMKRIEDLQHAMNGELDSDSDGILSDADSDSSDDDMSNLLDSRRASHIPRASRTLETMHEEPESRIEGDRRRFDSDSDEDEVLGSRKTSSSQHLYDDQDGIQSSLAGESHA